MKLSNYIDAYEEEKIAVLWTICAILCFAYGFTFWAWAFTAKAAVDNAMTLYAAAKQAKRRMKHENLSHRKRLRDVKSRMYPRKHSARRTSVSRHERGEYRLVVGT